MGVVCGSASMLSDSITTLVIAMPDLSETTSAAACVLRLRRRALPGRLSEVKRHQRGKTMARFRACTARSAATPKWSLAQTPSTG